MSKQHLFADRAGRMKQSSIRKILPLVKRPGVIALAGGWPDPALFPADAIAEIAAHVAKTEPQLALQYGPSPGDPRLRNWLRTHLAQRKQMQIGEDEIIITSGSQQGIFLTNALLIESGDVIVTESPSFVGAYGSMDFFAGERIGIEMDEDGLNMDALEALVKERTVKYVYVIADFQNPTGRTMSVARRRRLVALAEQYDFMILEDAPYSELRYEGEPLPPIYALDPNQRTIYLGSFSKTFSPMRVGWLVAPAELVQKMTPIKQAMDTNTSALTQSIVYHFCERGLLDGQIAHINAIYKRRRDVMMASMDRYMPPEAVWTCPDGGMFAWLTLPDSIDTEELFHKALARDVAFVPGAGFYPDAATVRHNEARLNWVSASEAEIQTAMQVLADVIRAF